jgi:VIT1/CCC1 family predicted Fe2+/Mn2+ transporter
MENQLVEITRVLAQMSERMENNKLELKNDIRDLNKRFDQMDISIHDIKIELDAKIDSKVDKVRYEIVDLTANMEK